MVTLAAWHNVLPALWARLGRAADVLPADLADFLEAASHLNARRNARLVVQAGEIAATAADAGIPCVFLKGMALLLIGLHPDPAARFVADIDLLVPADALEATAAALAAAGYRRLPDRVSHAHDPLRFVRDDRPGLIELHQAPVAFRLAPALDARTLLHRAVPVVGRPEVRVPCPDDLVLHAILHTMLQDHHFRLSELPLRNAVDLDLIGRRYAGLDWPAIRSRLDRVAKGRDAFAFCLLATREALGAAHLPAPAAGPQAARRLAVWRRRRDEPAPRLASGLAFLSAYARDCLWRLRNVPDERRHLLRLALSPTAYPAILRSLATVAAEGPPATSRGARDTGR